jgi:rRNA-processing protein FCF1
VQHNVPSFSAPFQYHLPPSDEAVKSAMTTGLIVPDTNVLLSAYRFASTAREELLSILDGVKERIWIPNRVAEEFHKNRLEVIADHDTAYSPVIEALRAAQRKLDEDLDAKIAHLANRAALSDEESADIRKLIATSMDTAITGVEKLRRDHGLADWLGHDPILTKYQSIFDGKVGPPLGEADHKDAITEAQRRIDKKVPPGYRDAGKQEPHGDYFVWKQTLLRAAEGDFRYLVLVTNDTKEDWYKVVKGRTVGAHPLLSKELLDLCGIQLIMMSTTSFLHHAKGYLNFDVSQDTIRQSEALPKADQSPEQAAQSKTPTHRDLESLIWRIEANSTHLEVIKEALDNCFAEDPEGKTAETLALRNQYLKARHTKRTLEHQLLLLIPNSVIHADPDTIFGRELDQPE